MTTEKTKKLTKENRVDKRWTGQEMLNSPMIIHPLHNIPHHLRVKKRYRQLHELYQEIRQDGNIDPCINMQHTQLRMKLHGGLTEKEDKFGHKH